MYKLMLLSYTFFTFYKIFEIAQENILMYVILL